MTMTNWSAVPSGSLQTNGMSTAISLTISPDLDALLEFDEKARKARCPSRPSSSGKQTPASTPTAVPPVGLPPPPRRGTRSPTASRKRKSQISQVGYEVEEPVPEELFMPNPFINPPPPLEIMRAMRETPIEMDVTEMDVMTPPEMAENDCEGRGDQGVDPRQTLGVCPSSLTTKNRVDRLLGIGKIPFGRSRVESGEMAGATRNHGRFARMLPRPKHIKVMSSPDVLDDGCSVGRSTWQPEPSSHDRPPSRKGSGSDISRWRPSMSPLSSSHNFPLYVGGEHDFFDLHSPAVPRFTLSDDEDDMEDVLTVQCPSRTPSPASHVSGPLRSKPSPPPGTSPSQRYDEPKHVRVLATSSFLDMDERSGLIKKNKKLMRVFGQPPGPDALSQQERGRSRKVVEGVRSVRDFDRLRQKTYNDHHIPFPQRSSFGHDRRHSDPVSPDNLSLLSSDAGPDSSSQRSFIDLSDDLGTASLGSPGQVRPSSPSQQSWFDNLSFDEQADELRKRKREKIARLHRFLGSQVPVNLVLGLDHPESTLPPIQSGRVPDISDGDRARKIMLRRRRCSSAEGYRLSWFDEFDRIKEDLNVKEKALNVRRAQKMEKVFGVAPPQDLYHTRRSPSPSVPVATPSPNFVSGWAFHGERLQPVPGQRNPNRSSYIKPKRKKEQRPSTSESSRALLPKQRPDWNYFISTWKPSIVYSHYQESLNSLDDIMDRDDKESLAELHEYLNSGDMTLPPPTPGFSQAFIRTASGDRRASNASSTRSERRLSLPTSVMSFSSDLSNSNLSPRPEPTDFQARRRRAAKLTHFFGVNHRELITDVFEGIEHNLEHERKQGTLNQEEIQDLLIRLRRLRTKREAAL